MSAAEVIRQHVRVDRGCACGWGAWGASHAEHVADALAEAGCIAGAGELAQWQRSAEVHVSLIRQGERLTMNARREAAEQRRRAERAEAAAVEQRERAETAEEQVVRLTAERDRWPAEAVERVAELEDERDDALKRARALTVQLSAVCGEAMRAIAHRGRRIDEARRVSRQRDRLRAELDGLRQVVAVSGSEYRRVHARVDTARARLYLALGHDQHPTARTLAVHVLAALEPQEPRP